MARASPERAEIPRGRWFHLKIELRGREARVFLDGSEAPALVNGCRSANSDEIVIFLNGRPLFRGRSAWRFRDETALGIMDVENDAVYLPLRRGRNELVAAVAEYFGGWGLIARIDDPTGCG